MTSKSKSKSKSKSVNDQHKQARKVKEADGNDDNERNREKWERSVLKTRVSHCLRQTEATRALRLQSIIDQYVAQFKTCSTAAAMVRHLISSLSLFFCLVCV